MTAAKQQAIVAELKRQVLGHAMASGPATSLEWPDFLGPHPLESGVWHEAHREHHHCPAWAAERREVAFPTYAFEAPPCVKLHGLLLVPQRQGIIAHEPALVSRPGVHTVD
eukprot:2633569-Amphidinium_carterae.1